MCTHLSPHKILISIPYKLMLDSYYTTNVKHVESWYFKSMQNCYEIVCTNSQSLQNFQPHRQSLSSFELEHFKEEYISTKDISPYTFC